MEKQRARTEAEKAFRRDKLLTAAKRLFSEHGFQGTKITMITSEAGLSPAAFYLYFKNKVEIYRTLSIDGTDILEGMIRKAVSSSAVSSAAKIEALAGAYFNFFMQKRAYYDIITVHHLGQKDFFTSMNLVPQLENRNLALLDILAAAIDEGIAAGEFRPVDAWKTAATMWAMMDGVLLLAVRRTTEYIRLDIDTLITHYLHLCLSALER